MKITGEQTIPAAQDRVWHALNDPDVLRQAAPAWSRDGRSIAYVGETGGVRQVFVNEAPPSVDSYSISE